MQATPGDKILYSIEDKEYLGVVENLYENKSKASVSLAGVGDVIKTENNFTTILSGKDIAPIIIDEDATIEVDVDNRTLVITT